MRVHYYIGLAILGVLVAACVPAPPTVTSEPAIAVITSPSSSITYLVGDLVTVQSTSASPAGIARVELLVDGALARVDSPSQPQTPYSVSQNWTAVEGVHLLQVRPFDAANRPGSPATLMVTVLTSQATTTSTSPVVLGPLLSPALTPTPQPAPTLQRQQFQILSARKTLCSWQI